MGELDEAIREHLELKRRRGADPGEVAREEHDALSPVTRGHAVLVPQESGPEHEGEADPAHNDHETPHADAPQLPAHEDLDHATQEFRVEHGESSDDWLDDRDA